MAVVAITMLNFDSDLVMSFGGKEASASENLIPCWSQIKVDSSKATTWCAGCVGKVGYEKDGGEGMCSGSNPGEN